MFAALPAKGKIVRFIFLFFIVVPVLDGEYSAFRQRPQSEIMSCSDLNCTTVFMRKPALLISCFMRQNSTRRFFKSSFLLALSRYHSCPLDLDAFSSHIHVFPFGATESLGIYFKIKISVLVDVSVYMYMQYAIIEKR